MIGTKSAYQRILRAHDENAYDYDNISQLKEAVRKVMRIRIRVQTSVYFKYEKVWRPEYRDITINSETTVLDLKLIVWPKYVGDNEGGKYTLQYNGKDLEDFDKLSEYGIKYGDTIKNPRLPRSTTP